MSSDEPDSRRYESTILLVIDDVLDLVMGRTAFYSLCLFWDSVSSHLPWVTAQVMAPSNDIGSFLFSTVNPACITVGQP
jgi:hypothetical protein